MSSINPFNVLLGAFPCIEIRLILKRIPGYYILTIVFPSAAIVILSWSVFFVPVNLPTAKLSIALMTALSSVVMFILSRASLAPELIGVQYITVMDIWMVSHLLFVFCAVIIQLIVIGLGSHHQNVLQV